MLIRFLLHLTFRWPCIVINFYNKTNYIHWILKFIFGTKLYMLRTVPLPIIGSFHCTHSNGICHTGLLTACKQDQDGNSEFRPDPARKLSASLYVLLCVQWKNPDDWQSPKHVEFYSKSKSEKIMHLVGFIITLYITC